MIKLNPMNIIKTSFLLWTLVNSVLFAQEILNRESILDSIVAIVDEGVVLESQLNTQIAIVKQRAEKDGFELPERKIIEEQILEQLILEEIQLQRAERIGIRVSDQMLNGAISMIAEQNNTSFEKMPDMLAKDDIDYGEFRRDLRKQLTLEQLRDIDVISRITASNRELSQCLEIIENNIVNDSEYNLSHILISVPESATADQYSKAENEAYEVINQLGSGASFNEMAITYSDSETSLNGGSLGWRKGNQLPTLFLDVIGTLEKQEFSQPIQSVSGFHIIRVNDFRQNISRSEIEQTEVRHILVIPNQIIDNETAKQKLEEAREQILNGEKFGEVAKLLSEDPGSVDEGGSMGWSSPGIFVEEFEKIVGRTEIGQISQPFQSRFGWHILEVTGRRTYDNTEDLKELNCMQQIKNSKIANETELWLRRIRDEAFVDKRI
jgi:peptidyl-prolyl cis-trans isomerase SurA